MGVTHISIYKGYASQVLAQSATPTNRENAEYLVGSTSAELGDGDWYFDTDTNSLEIYIGATWSIINFGF